MYTRIGSDAESARARHLVRCERAIELAAEDAKHHPEAARAIEIVRLRMSQA